MRRHEGRKAVAHIMLHSLLLIACLLLSRGASCAVPEVSIADGPLYGGSVNVHPNMMLDLSVEFPTVGIAYRADGGTYNRGNEYIGYFNPLKCYAYPAGNRNITDGYFTIAADADPATHECDGKSFSGNFMNWVASSAIDMLRYALTGGDRVIDTAGSTVLQRAYLPESFYANGTYFPRRSISAGGNASAPGKVTPFDVTKLYVVSCRNRILFSDVIGASNNCDTPAFDAQHNLLNTDRKLGEYLARVEVCDGAEGPQRADLCRRFGSGYKPAGVMQQYSERIRFAAMGYLMDNANTRYGGVLRAPMKYVGAKKFDAPAFTESVNGKPEWDPANGIFYSNPEVPADRNSTTDNSGVINYLNKFGRSGVYKTLDPVSELYYESIRYLQGKQPTLEATAGMTDAMKDGFPVITGWNDPVTASCQNNYVVTIADVNTWYDRYIPGNERTTYNGGADAHDPARPVDALVPGVTPALDVKPWTKLVGAMEADSGGTYGNPAPRTGLANLDILDTGAGGAGTYYMAGLAYWANTHPIRLDKPVKVRTFAIDVDEGGNGLIDGNIRTVKPRDSQLYLAAKYGGFIDRNGDGNPFKTFGADGVTTVTGNAEWDSAGTGAPDTYFLAGQPKAMIQAIRKIFATIASTSGTIAGVTASGSKVTASGAYVYQPGFDPSNWSGSLKRFKLTLDESGNIHIASVPDWDAGQILTGTADIPPHPAPADRQIYTSTFNAGHVFYTIPFKWDQLTPDQQALLDASPDDGQADGKGMPRLNYLRGVRAGEEGMPGGVFRTRGRVLGDIVNSNAVHVGAPSVSVRGDGYASFYDAHKSRAHAVYAGANDGMLHAFDASDGSELFAYVPQAVLPRLNRLTSPAYSHRPYVDGPMAAGEAKIGTGWKTVLAAGMGGGAQGVIALDISDPANFGAGSGALWEFTDADDPDMGNVLGTPVIAKFVMKVVDGVPQYRYFVVVSSGLNNYKDDGDGRFDGAAPGALFLLALDKAADVQWAAGINYYKFTLPIADPALANGLSAPGAVLGADGAVRYVYAGDLQGNLWRFNFTGGAPWSSALGAPPAQPLFTAKDGDGNRQPITTQPKIVFAPGGGYVALFGTGKFVEPADTAPGGYRTQSFYAIYDTTNDGDKLSSRSELAARTMTSSGADGVTISGDSFAYGTTAGTKKGWYVDFANSAVTGERSVTDPLTAYGRLFFNTLIPGADPCGSGGGRAYAVDVLTGLPVSEGGVTGLMSTVGLLAAPALFDAGDPALSDRNAIGRRTAARSYSVFNFGTGGQQGAAAPAQGGNGQVVVPAGRFSWREVPNWQELRAAANPH